MFWGDDDGDESLEDARERMVRTVASRTDVDDDTLEAVGSVPRHEFVPGRRRENAYADRPLPIGDDQTISAPHMVAIMTDRLELSPGEAVLEIGTGCGYHAAVTAEVVGDDNVYSVEYGESLAENAREALAELGYEGVSVRVGDGREGWAEHAPYDAAYMTCAAQDFPERIVEQVRPGGRLLAPLGRTRQTLVYADKREDGHVERSERGGVRFVTMRG